MDSSQKLVVIIISYLYIRYFRPRLLRRKRDNTSGISGHQYTMELLTGTDRQCIELLRMSREAFVRLCTHFRVRGWLNDSRNVSVEEKMAIFLFVIGHNQRFVVLKRRFQHSLQTIHKVFHEVMDKMMEFAQEVIVPTSFNPSPDYPGTNKRLRRVFKGAVGALDGTLVHAIVPSDQQHLYRGRGKGECNQNVLGICDFNMIFTFVVAGWEGVAHDSRVLSEAMANPTIGFPFPPPDKYYLCDAAYTNTRGFMSPYRNVRYWLGDFRRRRAITRKEKFNHSHAKLRNVIERAYGVLKSCFAILKKMTTFSFDTQRDVVIACFVVHNFIRKEGFNDEYFAIADLDNLEVENINVQLHAGNYEVHPLVSASDQQFMVNLREQIAAQLMPNEE